MDLTIERIKILLKFLIRKIDIRLHERTRGLEIPPLTPGRPLEVSPIVQDDPPPLILEFSIFVLVPIPEIEYRLGWSGRMRHTLLAYG